MTVSIVLPIYQRAHTLARCLESVRAQTFADWELIGVDDASTDDSAAVFEGFADPRFRLLRHGHNQGPSAARNTAFAAARGEYVALIDSDDEWLPEKLELQLALLRSGAADGCGCEYWRVRPEGTVHHRLPEPASWREDFAVRCELTGSTVMARRECVEAIGPMDPALRLYEDWDWMFRFAQRYRFTVIHEPLARVYDSGPRDPGKFAECAEYFLNKHAAEFAQPGVVRSHHYEYVAASALAQRRFGLGCAYVLKAVAAAPSRRPELLGALPLAGLDHLLGTAFLESAARRSRP